MLGGQEKASSVQHLARLFALADHAGLLRDPATDRAAHERPLVRRGMSPGDSHGPDRSAVEY